jgi:uncharacterized C2H2 Zn-finger protein
MQRCTHAIYMQGPYDEELLHRCVRCNHLYDHRAVTREGTLYSHACGEWVEIWPSKHARCAHTVYHKEDHIGEVVTNHLPRKDYAAYVNRAA